jgi:hypothetical protein
MKGLYLSVSLKAIINCDSIKNQNNADECNSDSGICAKISDLNHEANAYEDLKA